MSEASIHGLVAGLSGKGQRILEMYIHLYQATSPMDVTKTSLMQIRGCGERTASEIVARLNKLSREQVSLRIVADCQE